MTDQDDIYRNHQRPTEDSLDFAETVAAYLDSDLDRESTRDLSNRLHGHYFNCLLQTLNVDPATIDFDAASYKNISAAASKSASGKSVIEFDEYLDFWLFSCCHLTTIMACKPLDGEEYRETLTVFQMNLAMRHDPSLQREVAARDKKLAAKHMDCMRLSHALSRAMIIFFMCHELAHVQLGHLDTEKELQHELDADKHAAKLFLSVVDADTAAGDIFVSPKLTCAPLLLFRFLEMSEAYELTKRSGDSATPFVSDHPIAFERYRSIYPTLKDTIIDRSEYILTSFRLALDDAAKLLEIEGYGNECL